MKRSDPAVLFQPGRFCSPPLRQAEVAALTEETAKNRCHTAAVALAVELGSVHGRDPYVEIGARGSEGLSVGGCQATRRYVVRDLDTIDADLRLVVAFRRQARQRGGPLPSIDVADGLLDERLDAIFAIPQ